MKYQILIIFLLTTMFRLSAQPQMKLKVTEHDFGVFKEEEGKKSFTFEVANTGDQPLVIQNIVASCGCTTPDWTRTPIAPGAKGEIKAVYDPQNRPGPFSKTLTVFSNSMPSPVVLHLKGEVKGVTRTIQDYYPWQVGSVKFKANNIAFPQVLNTEKRIRVLQIINTSKSPVKIEFADVPPYMELKAVPQVLDGGKKGLIECVYYGDRVSKWGNVTDKVRIKLDGNIHPEELFIMAGVVEDFSKLSKAEIESAPVFKADILKTDLGTIEAGAVREFEIRVKNTGRRDLIIRSIWSSCSCLKPSGGEGLNVKQGSEGVIKMIFNAERLSGKIVRSINIYTNDPANAKVTFQVQALVNQKK